jgi:hypothetical protein
MDYDDLLVERLLLSAVGLLLLGAGFGLWWIGRFLWRLVAN